jgi:CMD domain protein
MPTATDDVIGTIAGITPGSRADQARRQKPELIAGAQDYYAATITPDDPGGLSLPERSLVAFRVALLTPSAQVTAFYRARLDALDVDPGAVDAVERFPDGGEVDDRFTAILRHVDRNTTAPREAGPEHLRQLADAGLGPYDIVSLSQVIAFVSYQVRLVAALAALEQAS